MDNLEETTNNNMSLKLVQVYGCSDSDSDSSSDDGESMRSPRIDNIANDVMEDSDGLSDMVRKNNIINACAHGPLDHAGASEERSRHMIIDGGRGVLEYEVTEYRDIDSDDSVSSDSSDVDSVKDIEEICSSDDESGWGQVKVRTPPKVRGELTLEELPPIEELAISLPEKDCSPIGTVFNIVDKLVIVQALPQTPAVDLDSVLFLDKGARPLGKVFDVFGPVTEPYYCVRFNSTQHIREARVEKGMEVYIAPRTAHTNYVFLSQLMKIKGSDASWLNDVEPPPSQVDFSDDEEERRVKRAQKDARKHDQDDEETKKKAADAQKKNLQKNEANSRFGSGPSSKTRSPFGSARRHNAPFQRPWLQPGFNPRTPPPAGPGDHGVPPFPPPVPFNPHTPPPFFGQPPMFFGRPRMYGPPVPRGRPPFRQNMPVFGNFCTMSPPPPHWFNSPPPPPPGT